MATTLRARAMASSSLSAVSWAMPERTEAEEPPMSSSESSLPATAETTRGPLTKRLPFLLMTTTSLMPAMAEAVPPQCPSTSVTCGTTPDRALTRPAIMA